MSRSRMMQKPVRLHLSLEKKTVAKLRKLARQRAQTITQIMRDLAESYAKGRLSLPGGEPLSQVIRRINALRSRSAPVSDRSETLIRSWRDARA
jgi:hypothetical protein